MKTCRICGKRFDVLYPDIWAYRRGNTQQWKYFCSWGCLRKYDKEGEKGSMGRPRKDGTPARKPERKPKVEVTETLPEEARVELVYDPGIAEEYRREHPEEYERMREEMKMPNPDYQKFEDTSLVKQMETEMEKLEVCGVRSRVKKDCSYERVEQPAGRPCEMSLSNGGMWLQFTAEDWRKFATEIMLALQQLGL